MRAYKLRFEDRDQAEAELLSKGVYFYSEDEQGNDVLSTSEGVRGVVYIGLIPDVLPEYNEQGELISEGTYLDGYHVDVFQIDSYDEIDFGDSRIYPDNPYHVLA